MKLPPSGGNSTPPIAEIVVGKNPRQAGASDGQAGRVLILAPLTNCKVGRAVLGASRQKA